MEGWEIWFAALPGLILFLFGIEQFSSEIQKVAGERFRAFIKASTRSPLRSALLGAIVTAIVQSSTAVSMIAMGLVESGHLSFFQSLGIVLGAGIGTTVTGQLVAFRISGFGPFFIVAGFLIRIAGGRFSFIGKPLFFFGLVFFGLGLVSASLEPLRGDPAILSYLSALSDVRVAILAGFIATNIFQSSGIFSGLVVLLAGNGLISTEQAIPLILGSNIGTITPLVASLRMGLFSRRLALAQQFYSLFGVVLLVPFLPLFTSLIISLGGDHAQQVANAHTLFNIMVSALFLLILQPYSRLVERILPGKEEEILFRTASLNDHLPQDNSEAFTEVEKELANLLQNTKKAVQDSAALFAGADGRTFQRVLKREALNDFLDERIEQATVELSRRALTETDNKRLVILVRMSNALEQLGDIAASMGYTAKKRTDRGLPIEGNEDLEPVYHLLMADFGLVGRSLPYISAEDVAAMRANEISMRERINSSYSRHLRRISARKDYPAGPFAKAVSRIELAHSKLREIRKLAESYVRIVRD